jgi:hypothetical protein
MKLKNTRQLASLSQNLERRGAPVRTAVPILGRHQSTCKAGSEIGYVTRWPKWIVPLNAMHFRIHEPWQIALARCVISNRWI